MLNAPVETLIPLLTNGTYRLKVNVLAKEASEYIIFCENRRWLYEGSLKDGEKREHCFTVNLCDTNQFEKEYCKKEALPVGVMGKVSYTCQAEAVETPTIYIAGDSTVTDQNASYPYIPASTYCGWGQMLPLYLEEGLAVSNHAQSGLTTKDFKKANWLLVKERLKPGDYLIIEFGHNDQKKEDLKAFGGYAENLRYYVQQARALGALPILCSPINRILFGPDGKIINLLGEYRNAVKFVAAELQVPFLDLWQRTTEYMEAVGEDDAWDYFWCDGNSRDYTHTNDIGGKLIARLAAQEIQKSNLADIKKYIRSDCIATPIPKPSGRKNLAKNLNDYRTIGLVNLPDLDKDITSL